MCNSIASMFFDSVAASSPTRPRLVTEGFFQVLLMMERKFLFFIILSTITHFQRSNSGSHILSCGPALQSTSKYGFFEDIVAAMIVFVYALFTSLKRKNVLLPFPTCLLQKQTRMNQLYLWQIVVVMLVRMMWLPGGLCKGLFCTPASSCVSSSRCRHLSQTRGAHIFLKHPLMKPLYWQPIMVQSAKEKRLNLWSNTNLWINRRWNVEILNRIPQYFLF